MIGKSEWFTYRIFGWGLRPKTKEGWFYVIAILAIVGIMAVLPIPQNYKTIASGIVIGLALLDILHMMTGLDKHHDERERRHQLIIERNCSFAAIASLVLIAVYQSIKNTGQAIPFDISIMVVLGIMLGVKNISTIYVKFKM